MDQPPQPGLSFSPDRARVLQLAPPPPLPPVAELARPELKLAGVRVDAELNARSRMGHYVGLSLVTVTDATVLPAPVEETIPITARRGGR